MKYFGFLILFTASSFAIASNQYISYETLTQGMKPSEAYVAGANKLLDLVALNEDYACKFMVSQTHSSRLKQVRELVANDLETLKSKNKISTEQVESILSLSDQELLFNGCMDLGLASEATNTRASLDDISQELIQGHKAFFRAKFANGSVRTVLMKLENNVWKVAATQ